MIPEAVTQTVVSSDPAGEGEQVAGSGEDPAAQGDQDDAEAERPAAAAGYGQLLQAGLSSGGLQPSEIPQVSPAPTRTGSVRHLYSKSDGTVACLYFVLFCCFFCVQVVDALENATINLDTELMYQTLALAVPKKEKRAPIVSFNGLGLSERQFFSREKLSLAWHCRGVMYVLLEMNACFFRHLCWVCLSFALLEASHPFNWSLAGIAAWKPQVPFLRQDVEVSIGTEETRKHPHWYEFCLITNLLSFV